MWGPTLAVLILRRGKRKGFLRAYGWQFERLSWPWLIANVLTPIAYVLLTLAFVFILGNVSGIDGFGTLDISKEGMAQQMETLAIEAGQDPAALEDADGLFTSLPLPGWGLLLLTLILSVIPGITLNLLFAFGEELGWRGLMMEETRKWGYVPSALFMGLCWGLWHAPLVLQGHNYPDFPYWGIFMMCLFCISISLVMNLLAQKGGTIFGAAAFHGVVNAIAGVSPLVIINGNPLLGSSVGIAGVLAGICIFIFFYFTQKETLTNWSQLSYDPDVESLTLQPEGQD